MTQARWCASLLLLLGFFPSAVVGQDAPPTPRFDPLGPGTPAIHASQVRDSGSRHPQKLAGFGAGITVTAIALSLDEVLGSSCIGSGSYLTRCRVGYAAAVAVGGGLGALVGAIVKTEDPPGRAARTLFGAALGTMGVFLASNLACEQERSSNPGYLCGYDGMVSTRATLVGALVGGALGASIGRGAQSIEVGHVGPVPGHRDRVGMGAVLVWRH